MWVSPCFTQMHRLKVTGEAKYTADISMPGQVYAKILRPPSHHVKLLSVDYSEAEKMDGVEVVRDGDLIAVLHSMTGSGRKSPGHHKSRIHSG